MEVEVALRDGTVRPATLTPAATPEARGGLVLVHGARYGERRHPLYVRTAHVMAAAGLHVVAFDRRQTNDVLTLEQQTEDAQDAALRLRQLTGMTTEPVGWWGWSQGAWVATLAAAGHSSSFVFLVGYSIQSPAEQMRHYTRNLLIEAGYDQTALAELALVRGAYEDYLRGTVSAEEAAAVIMAHRDRAWFGDAWVPEPPLPDAQARRWMMAFDPRGALAELPCRVTAVWGARDNVVDVEAGRRSVEELGPAAHAHVLDAADHGLNSTEDEVPVTTYDSLLSREAPWLLQRRPDNTRGGP